MPADIDVLVSGSSSLGFTQRFQFGPEVQDYDVSSDILNLNDSKPLYGSRNDRLDLAAALGSSPTSSSYLGHTPPTHFTFHGRCSSPTLRSVSPSSPLVIAKTFTNLRLTATEKKKMPVAVPRRSCLVVRCDVLDLSTVSKIKKKVVFADDRGFPLTLVRTMTEPSNVPPQLSVEFLGKTNGEQKGEKVREPWDIVFPQPASDYLDFRRRLDLRNVSLENVIVKDSEEVVLGTVKVRNLVFHKEVIVRMTSDNWETQKDVPCNYVDNSSPPHGVTVLYDTFSFRLCLPPNSDKIEFCVCYKNSGTEYWDNNNGKNYVLMRKDQPKKRSFQKNSVDQDANRPINLSREFGDDVKSSTRLESWSESASWNDLNISTPYW